MKLLIGEFLHLLSKKQERNTRVLLNPDPSHRFSHKNGLVLIGNAEAESRFFEMHPELRKIGVEKQ